MCHSDSLLRVGDETRHLCAGAPTGWITVAHRLTDSAEDAPGQSQRRPRAFPAPSLLQPARRARVALLAPNLLGNLGTCTSRGHDVLPSV